MCATRPSGHFPLRTGRAGVWHLLPPAQPSACWVPPFAPSLDFSPSGTRSGSLEDISPVGDPHCKGFISDGTRESHISLSYHCSFYYNLTISLLSVPIFPCLLALMLSSWPILLWSRPPPSLASLKPQQEREEVGAGKMRSGCLFFRLPP